MIIDNGAFFYMVRSLRISVLGSEVISRLIDIFQRVTQYYLFYST